MQPAFRTAELAATTPIVVQVVERELDVWHNHAVTASSLDIATEMRRLAFEVGY